MFFKNSILLLAGLSAFAQSGLAVAQDETRRSYDRAFFDSFAPQTALEMIDRLPGFVLQEADEARGLSQGGTNVLINGQPIIGKGETATTQISQTLAKSVVRIDILDAAALDLPGYSGLVANIITQQSSLGGSWVWEPEWRPRLDAALANGNISLSGSRGDVDFSAAFNSQMVRAGFFGPETLSDSEGTIFERRDESLEIRGEQPAVSGSLQWKPTDDKIVNVKASYNQLNLNRPQISETVAITDRGLDSINVARFSQDQTNTRLDGDYSFPAFNGSLKLIGLANRQSTDSRTRVTVDDPAQTRLTNLQFSETSERQEGVLRFEQNWAGSGGQSWQLGGEGAYNGLDIETEFFSGDLADPNILVSRAQSETEIEELRGELTLAYQRPLNSKTDLQLSIGAETSTIKQGEIERSFNRPKGFLSVTTRPADGWTLTARAAREIGQINFRNFAATTSLVEGVSTQDNPELVPQQSWAFLGRAERQFTAGHVASVEVGHDLISDLVDRIPLGASGDAIGNISDATQTRLTSAVTLAGAPFGLTGAQLDLRGTWRWSSVEDPIEGFDRDIAGLRQQDLKAEFRHDIAETDWSYGFTVQRLKIAPTYESTLVRFTDIPGGGLTPGENSVFIEHKDILGLRIRATLSEFLEQESEFTRIIYDGRRDLAPIDRIESRRRDLDGPFLKLSIGDTF